MTNKTDSPSAKKRCMSIFRKIERAKAAISKERDQLRTLISDAEDLAECCDDALDSLEVATDALSKYL